LLSVVIIMGCDGGTIPTRDEMIRLKKKPEQKDKDSERIAKWKSCNLTQQPLQSPIVACELGHLYNKESVIEFLLDRTKYTTVDYIRGLKDIKEINLTLNKEKSKERAEDGNVYIDTFKSKFICPVTGFEMSGLYKFVFLYSCGCVFSERAIKDVKVSNCFKCAVPFTQDDIVILNGNEEDEEVNRSKMLERRRLAKLNKKEKKKRKVETVVNSDSECFKAPRSVNGESSRSIGKSVHDDSDSSSCSKIIKLGGESSKLNVYSDKTLPTVGKIVSDLIPKKKLSIQEDPKMSKIYKSLFTTSSKAKNQMQGNWVTFNPFYN